jgi:mono/diheme cytochrome c family protein
MNNYFKFLLICFLSIVLSKSIYSQTEDEWVAPKSADNLINPLAGLQPTEAAQQLYVSNCLPCHGDKGKGDGPIGASLDPRPYNLTKKKVDNETDGSVFWRITNGHKSMPTFKNTLDPMQRWQIVTYIRSLQQQAETEAKAKQKKK